MKIFRDSQQMYQLSQNPSNDVSSKDLVTSFIQHSSCVSTLLHLQKPLKTQIFAEIFSLIQISDSNHTNLIRYFNRSSLKSSYLINSSTKTSTFKHFAFRVFFSVSHDSHILYSLPHTAYSKWSTKQTREIFLSLKSINSLKDVR
jgi:hypothetical protein